MAKMPQEFTVVRKARGGRKRSAAMEKAFSTLSKLYDAKTRQTIRETDESGNELRTYKAVVVTPETVGKSAEYTGMNGLIGTWAKETGRSVSIRKVSDTHYAIVDKG